MTVPSCPSYSMQASLIFEVSRFAWSANASSPCLPFSKLARQAGYHCTGALWRSADSKIALYRLSAQLAGCGATAREARRESHVAVSWLHWYSAYLAQSCQSRMPDLASLASLLWAIESCPDFAVGLSVAGSFADASGDGGNVQCLPVCLKNPRSRLID